MDFPNTVLLLLFCSVLLFPWMLVKIGGVLNFILVLENVEFDAVYYFPLRMLLKLSNILTNTLLKSNLHLILCMIWYHPSFSGGIGHGCTCTRAHIPVPWLVTTQKFVNSQFISSTKKNPQLMRNFNCCLRTILLFRTVILLTSKSTMWGFLIYSWAWKVMCIVAPWMMSRVGRDSLTFLLPIKYLIFCRNTNGNRCRWTGCSCRFP